MSESKQTPLQLMQEMENELNQKVRELNAAKDVLLKSQETVIAAQEAAFKAYQALAVKKELYLVSIIQQQRDAKAPPKLETVVEEVPTASSPREDNL